MMNHAVAHHQQCVRNSKYCHIVKHLCECDQQPTELCNVEESPGNGKYRINVVSPRRYTRYILPNDEFGMCSNFRFVWPIELNKDVWNDRTKLSLPDVHYKLRVLCHDAQMSSTDSRLATLVSHREIGKTESTPAWCNTVFGILRLQLNFPRLVANLIVIQALVCDNTVTDNTLLQICRKAPIQLLEEMMRLKKSWCWSGAIAMFPSITISWYETKTLEMDFLQNYLEPDEIPALEYDYVAVDPLSIKSSSAVFDYRHLHSFYLRRDAFFEAQELYMSLPIVALFIHVCPHRPDAQRRTFNLNAVSLHIQSQSSAPWYTIDVPAQAVSHAPGWFYVPVADLQMRIDDAMFANKVDSLMATAILDRFSISFHGSRTFDDDNDVIVDIYARTANVLRYANATQSLMYVQ